MRNFSNNNGKELKYAYSPKTKFQNSSYSKDKIDKNDVLDKTYSFNNGKLVAYTYRGDLSEEGTYYRRWLP